MKKFMLHGFLAMLAASMIVGCGSSGGDDGDGDDTVVTDPPVVTPATTVDMGKTTYLVPDGTAAKSAQINGVNENMLTSGTKEEVGGFVHTVAGSTASPKNTNLLIDAKRMQKGVQTVFSALNNDTTTVDSISLLTSQNFQTPYTFTLASYNLTTVVDEQPLNLAGKIISIINGGAGTSGISIADPSAPTDTEFVFLLLYGDYQGSMFYIAAVVPKSQYAQYATITSMIVNAARVAPTGTSLQSSAENYNVTTGSGMADFLFVVDDSGSMSDDQDALAKAAEQFTAVMSGSGVTYRSAIITTGYGADDNVSGAAYSILRNVGIIENNNSMLEQELVAGTGGSATETGIWNAEQSLQSVASGDSANGAVTALGMPKSGASLSVIIVSDEDSQYTRRSLGGMDFNVSDNLFLDRSIRVYSIISADYSSWNPSAGFDDDNSSQYDDLSMTTGGIFSDIENKDSNGTLDYSAIMQQIATDAGGASSSFVLAHPAAVINKVTVDGNTVLHDTTNGYTYVQSSRAILFHGTAVPANGATVVVEYEYYH